MKALFISILSLLLLNFNSLYPQTWPKYYGQANRREYAVDLIETYDNGYLICGYFNSIDYSQRWGWLIKTDVNGNIIWEKVIENTGSRFRPSAVEQVMDGGILIAGMSFHNGKNYPIVIKLNACGEKVWCKIFDGSPNTTPIADDIKETESGDIIVLFNQFGAIPDEMIHLLKIDSFGQVMWLESLATTQNYPNSGVKRGARITVTSLDEYILSGYGYWQNPWEPEGPFLIRPLFIKVDSNGQENWVLPVGLNDTIYGRGKSSSQVDGNFIVGVADRWTDSNTSESLLLLIDSNGMISEMVTIDNQKINASITKGVPVHLRFLNQKAYLGGLYGSQTIGLATEIILDSNFFFVDSILNSIQHSDTRDVYNLVSVNDNKVVNQSNFIHSANNTDIFLAKLNLNLEYDTAYTGNYTYDSLCIPGPPQSGFIYLNDCDIVLGTEMPTAADYRARVSTIPITIYPNPAKDQITFALENTEHHRNVELRCFNLLGMQQYQTQILRGQQQASANVSNWPPGMYIAVVLSDGKPVGRGKFVVH